jgi:2,5-diketo-D-gluconate reductase A
MTDDGMTDGGMADGGMAEAKGIPAVTLPGEVAMPLVGFGTWQLRGRRAYDAVRYALDVGYRHFDTATMYGNEADVGRALRDSGLDRGEIFVTTKLPARGAGRERETILASLRALDTDYVDLWLVHWPPGGSARPGTWQQLLTIRGEGMARAVGVSNYSVGQLDELIDATGEPPAVNQIPWSPSRHDPRALAGNRDRGVVVEGYSPLKGANLRDPVLAEIASRHGVTPAQVVLRWHLEHGIVVIPKSGNRDRIAANFDLSGFRLSGDEVVRIDGLSRR